jgi:predicted nucleotidyltransferase component of viral defense system
MNLSEKDYRKLYSLQDKFLRWWSEQNYPFYLTGGTALGRFYLNHRYSEDLDFFVNNDKHYPEYIKDLIKKITGIFNIETKESLFTEDFTRLFICSENIKLKIELVNDIDYYAGSKAKYIFGYIDTPLNILSNKLVAIINRNEPKDVYDILKISENYSFRWTDIFYHSKQKAVINELDVEERLVTFPAEWLQEVVLPDNRSEKEVFENRIRQIADDFILGRENTLGTGKLPIEKAQPSNYN